MRIKTFFIIILSLIVIYCKSNSTDKAINEIEKKTQENYLKGAMADVATIATVLADYITDNRKAPDHSGPLEIIDSLDSELTPYYIDSLPKIDPWGNRYLVYCGTACNEIYGLSGCVADDFVVISYGSDGMKENWTYDSNNEEDGLHTAGDLAKDLIMWNGTWISAPKSIRK